MQQNHDISSEKKRHAGFCPTRFVESHETIFTFLALYAPTLAYFEKKREYQLVTAISDPCFLVTTHCLRAVLGETKGLSVLLQALDLTQATRETQRVIIRLSEWRCDNNDAKFRDAFKSAEDLYGEPIPKKRVAKHQTQRFNLKVS